MENAHKRYNSIDQLMIQGELSQDPGRLKGKLSNIIESYILKPQDGDQVVYFLIVPD